MKHRSLFFALTALVLTPLVFAGTKVVNSSTGYHIGSAITEKLGFYGTTPAVQPANTRTARQALEDLGLMATGGSDTAATDALSKVADDTITDGVNYTVGGSSGTKIGTSATAEKLGFFNATPIVQPHGAAQAALTDSTGGDTSSATLAATAGIETVTIPLTSLATGLSTSAIDLLTTYTPGYKFKLLKLDFVTTVAGTGSGASQTFNLAIGSTPTTGGSLVATLSSTDTIGKITAASSITAANTGTASDTLSLKMAASGTVFTAGAGYFVVKIQNMDTADALARTAVLVNALRTGLVNLGLEKGAN
ncbi:MAG: hypothetical protein P4L99_28070 [Chthoniobacter sp.]|nr:hypothetical protein [Chthoniobacter sp.]